MAAPLGPAGKFRAIWRSKITASICRCGSPLVLPKARYLCLRTCAFGTATASTIPAENLGSFAFCLGTALFLRLHELRGIPKHTSPQPPVARDLQDSGMALRPDLRHRCRQKGRDAIPVCHPICHPVQNRSACTSARTTRGESELRARDSGLILPSVYCLHSNLFTWQKGFCKVSFSWTCRAPPAFAFWSAAEC